ncbi:MAG: fibrobacter succinogenes major paralogous domain-containing protein, partial [Oscillibacter sp.]|nr:fibrobacter succinogenes major paralogous domain-containing protein [Oscillibacter sp.]
MGALIGGVCWAKSNVDKPGTFAENTLAYGMLYQWNQKDGWLITDPLTGWDTIVSVGKRRKTIGDPCPIGWRMPTIDETKRLEEADGLSSESYNVMAWSKLGGGVHFPLFGFLNSPMAVPKYGYWTSSCDMNDSLMFWAYSFYTPVSFERFVQSFLAPRDYPFMIRCVADEKCDSIVRHDTVSINATDLPYDWRDTTFKEGTKTGTYRIQRRSCAYTDIAYLHLTVQSESEKPYPDSDRKGVLYNGVCWAKSNVDKPGTFVTTVAKPEPFAQTPELYGMLYQWNSEKGWIATNPFSEGDTIISDGNPCPAGWRIPTIDEIDLGWCKNCHKYDAYYFHYYWNDNIKPVDTLLIPAFGPFINESVAIPQYGYWSSSGSTDDVSKAWMFLPSRQGWDVRKFLVPRDYPFYIRCVTERHDTVIDVSVTIRAEDLPYEWGDTVFDIGTVSGTYRFQQSNCAFTNTIDLHLIVKSCPGVLINDVCWAEYNVAEPGRFANPGNAYGMLYQWNRRRGWPAIRPDSVSGWDSTLEPGDTWEPANDPCPIGWRMPTVEELKSLFDETRVNSIKTGWDRVLATRYTDIATGNMVFFPHANYRDEHGVTHNVLRKYYWSGANHWALWDNHIFCQQLYEHGYSVRCVADENACDIVLTASEYICKEDLPYTWHDTTFLKGTVSGEYCIRRTNQVSGCDSIFYLYLTVDTTCGRPCKERGVLINGVCWAESNVDSPNTFADTPEAFGLLYQWNKRKGYSLKGNIDVYDWYDGINENPYWEAVNNPCPADWHIPNVGDIYTLLDDLKVTREWTQQNGVSGVKFTDKFNGNAIFFPGAGSLHIWDIIEGGTSGSGYYWSTTKEYSNKAVYVFVLFEKSISGQSILPLPLNVGNNAYSVRCVAGRDTTGCSPIETATFETVCARDLPYPWGDTIFEVGTQSGVYRFQYISATTGCDSIVTLRLTVHASDTSFFDGVCYGSPYDNHGFNLPAVYRDTVIYDTLQSVFGCDSVRTLHLTVNPKYNIPLYDTVCQGDAYTQHGFSLSNLQTDGVHTLSLSSQAGCDSILILYLTVHPVYDTVLYDTVCQGDAYNNHGFSFNAVNASLTHTQTFQTIHGCDSIVTLNLHIWPSYLFADTINLCEGDTITFHSHKLYKSGVYDDSLKSVHGCDSIYRMTLDVHPVY